MCTRVTRAASSTCDRWNCHLEIDYHTVGQECNIQLSVHRFTHYAATKHTSNSILQPSSNQLNTGNAPPQTASKPATRVRQIPLRCHIFLALKDCHSHCTAACMATLLTHDLMTIANQGRLCTAIIELCCHLQQMPTDLAV